jgi:hypothetical protein
MKIHSFAILIIVLLSFAAGVEAQKCGPSSHKFYVLDDQGNSIKDVKFEFAEPEEGVTDKMEKFLLVNETSYTIFFGFDRPTPDGNKLVKISADGFEPFERIFYFRIAQYEAYNLILKRIGGTETARLEDLIHFTVGIEDKDKEPISGLKVVLKSADGKTFEYKTSEYGIARFDVLEGKYEIEIFSRDGFISLKREIIKISKKNDDLDIVLDDSLKPNF